MDCYLPEKRLHQSRAKALPLPHVLAQSFAETGSQAVVAALSASFLVCLAGVEGRAAQTTVSKTGNNLSSSPSGSSQPTNHDGEIARLELQLFSHTYAKEDNNSRLQRLEKTVFGSNRNGSPANRLQLLQASIAPANEAAASLAPDAAGHGASHAKSSNSPHAAQSQAIANSSSYPRVTDLEQFFLHQSFVGEPIQERLDRLEKRVIGTISGSTDLSQRVSVLSQYEARKRDAAYSYSRDDLSLLDDSIDDIYAQLNRHNPLITRQNATNALASSHYDSSLDYRAQPLLEPSRSGAANHGLLEQVSDLEKSVFGRSEPKKALPQRVDDLEQAVFQYHNLAGALAIPTRVKLLWQTMHGRDDYAQNLATTANEPMSPFGNDDQNGPGQKDPYQNGSTSPNMPGMSQSSAISLGGARLNNGGTASGSPKHGLFHKLTKTVAGVGAVAVGALGSGGMYYAPNYYSGAGLYPPFNYGGYGMPFANGRLPSAYTTSGGYSPIGASTFAFGF